MTSRTGLLFVLLATLATAVFAQEGSVKSRPAEKPSVEQLLKRLQSRNFKQREQATRALIEREDGLEALRQALRSGDSEVRQRAALVLREREKRARDRKLGRLMDYIKNGEVDSFVEKMWAVEDSIDDAVWSALSDLANRILAAGSKKQLVRITIPYVNTPEKAKYSKYRLKRIPPLKHLQWMRDVVAEVTGRDSLSSCFFVSRGRVRVKSGIGHTVIFANGDVIVSDVGGFHCSLIVCDGSIKAYGASGCLLIATGPIDVEYPGYLAIPNCREALGLIKFYDTKQAGVAATVTGGRVVVKKVLEGKPFACAGIRAGDVILAINGTKVRTEQEFRRLVRRAAVLGADTALSVERKNKGKFELQVLFKHR